jgi:hypothetical protein
MTSAGPGARRSMSPLRTRGTFGIPDCSRQFAMRGQMRASPWTGTRICGRVHSYIFTQLVAARMAGHVNERIGIRDDVTPWSIRPFMISRIAFSLPGMVRDEKTTYRRRPATHCAFVPGDLGKRRPRLALAAGQDDDDLVARDIAIFILSDERLYALHQADIAGDTDDTLHRTAQQQHLAPAAWAASAIERIRPTFEEKVVIATLPSAFSMIFRRLSRLPFPTARNAFAVGIGGIAHQASTPSSPSGAKASLVRQRPQRGRVIDLPVARYGSPLPSRRADHQRHRLGNGVVDGKASI